MAEVVATDRPVVLVTDVLQMASVQQGQPRVLTGEVGLETPVRWVHVAAGSGIAGLLAGGELILTTGAGWPRDLATLLAEVNELLQAGISGLFIEHGSRFTNIPEQVIDLCRTRGVALVELTRETSFVRVTEQVHRSILEEQSEALTARDQVQQMLTTLGLNRAPVDYVVQQLAATLSTTVVLESSLGEVVSWAGATASAKPSEVLALWPRNTAELLPEGWAGVAVESRDTRWGQLVAQPGPAHPAGRHTVLELAAVAIALGRLADPLERGDRWMSLGAKRVLDDLLQGQYRSDAEITAQLRAMGIIFEGSHVHAFSLQLEQSAAASHMHDLDDRVAELLDAIAPQGKVLAAQHVDNTGLILGILSLPRATKSVAELEPKLVARLENALLGSDGVRVRVALGPEATVISELVTSVDMASSVDFFIPTVETEHVVLCVIAKQQLAFFVNELKNDERLSRFTRSALMPLVEYEREHGGDLLRVLNAYVRHPTNRSQAAHAAQLSRSVFYQRLDLIQDLLGVDLTDGTVLASLLLALEAAPHLHLAS